MITKAYLKSNRLELLLLALTTMVTHGWILLTHSQYLYDGAICSFYLRHGDSNMESTMWIDLGLPINIFLLRFFKPFANPVFAYGVASLFLFFFTGLLISKILQQLKIFDRPLAMAAGLLYIAAPVTSMWPSLVFFPIACHPFAFFCHSGSTYRVATNQAPRGSTCRFLHC